MDTQRTDILYTYTGRPAPTGSPVPLPARRSHPGGPADLSYIRYPYTTRRRN